MACGTCGQRREVVDQSTAASIAAGKPRAKYVVTTPTGDVEEFDRYIDAVVFRRTSNGTLTTTTA
jgi:hypothetical protein